MEFWGASGVYLASRWVAPVPTNPNYLALKLYRNYDGQHHALCDDSRFPTRTMAKPNLFSSYAAINAAGTTLTVMVLNKAPSATYDAAQFTIDRIHAVAGDGVHAVVEPIQRQSWRRLQGMVIEMSFAPYRRRCWW